MLTDGENRECSGASDHSDMANADGGSVIPLGDFHFVGEAEWSDFCVAIERGANAGSRWSREADCNRIVHPVDMVSNVLDNRPDLVCCRIYDCAHPDSCHNSSVGSERSERCIGGVNRNVCGAVFGERRSSPVAPSFLEDKSCGSRSFVESKWSTDQD